MTKRRYGAGEVRAVKVDPQGDTARPSDTELTSSRQRILESVPAGWLDRLLIAAADSPLSSGEGAVVEGIVDCVSTILPTFAVGACFVGGGSAGRARPLVVKRLPEGVAQPAVGIDPTRIFPASKYEYVAALTGGYSSSTLHLASHIDELDADESPAVRLLERAAIVLSLLLPKARAAMRVAAGANRNTRAFERRMIQADKLATFGQLAAGVVHELNNPLTSIVAYSDHLMKKALEGGLSDAEDVERLRRISESANRMLHFTRELVCYARPSSGVAGPVSLHRAMDQAVAFCEHVLSTASVRVDRRYSEALLTVHGESEQLVQVFVNLLTNACQAALPAGGRIVLTTSYRQRRTGPRIVAVVEDNGGGIAADHLDHVFAPFFTTKRDRHGVGLGLSITKNIVESHDGVIRVESELGRGTRFLIELPAV
ncbi:MAG TPA: ATP-binding protein [Polyangiaceae bacterium]|jgi:signal transduction histidine kinase|nr:ATP-binding protein [Polyangiaceae bacterium]